MKCKLCGSDSLEISNYYEFSLSMMARKLPYLIPSSIVNLFAKNLFAKKILINKQYFSKNKVQCKNCDLGFVDPQFKSNELSAYYQKQYWDHRDKFEGLHTVIFENGTHFNDEQLSIHRERINFIHSYIGDYNSVIDFGAGDCSASFMFKKDNKTVTAFDYSDKSKHVCKAIGVNFVSETNNLPKTDLIYASHSLEHVEDITSIFNTFLQHPVSAKYLFFETPNIETSFIFKNLIHTPHTYMLNEKAFRQIAKKFNLKIIGLELSGSHWSYFKRSQKNCRPDIRVLFSKK
jgi:2-polyprenyl-3-methyl-5-hydroxy-6-metoxy-1,4-benzoquinol methylase